MSVCTGMPARPLTHMAVDPMLWQTGKTPMFAASYNGHVEVVKLLLAAGADKDAADEVGYAVGFVLGPEYTPAACHTHLPHVEHAVTHPVVTMGGQYTRGQYMYH